MRTISRRSRLAAIGLAAAVAAAAGTAYAAIPDASGVIHGCYTNRAGILRVIDSAAGQKCTSFETPLDWNQKGPKGDPGAQGPPGPAGSIGTLDDLEGIPCKGTKAHPGTVHVSYGTGSETEAPVSLTCVTPVVLNPGPFTVHVTGGTLQVGIFGETPLPTSGWQFAGSIDADGHVTIPDSGFQVSDIHFEATQDLAGFAGVHVTGTTSFASTGIDGFLDPETGAASLTGGVYATVQLTATAQVAGQTVQLYTGTCSFGSAANPMSWTLTTDPPGVPYSQSTGAVTLSSAFTTPSLAGCSPGVDPLYAFLLGTFAGHGRITFSGTIDPILTGP
jgi:hypothetical protein